MKSATCANSNPVKVSFVAQGPGQGWNLQHCLESGGPGNYPKLKADYNEQPTFTFDITNMPGVTFASDPVWVTAGTNKPTKLDSGLIGPVQGAGTRTISFQDLNNYNGGDAVTLTYTLRFSDGTATDPIIQNGGCCKGVAAYLPDTTAAFITDLAIAFVLGVVLTLIVQRFRRASASSNGL